MDEHSRQLNAIPSDALYHKVFFFCALTLQSKERIEISLHISYHTEKGFWLSDFVP